MERKVRSSGFPLHISVAVARAAKDAWTTFRRTGGAGAGSHEGGFVGGLEALEDRRLMAATVLTGTGFGTAGSYGNTGNTYDKALDGNANTFFDSTQATGAVVGMDLGSAKNVTAVQLSPRYGMGYRVTGAKIQGSNTSSTSGFVDLGTVSSAPADGTLTTYNLTNPGSYRWVRFVSPTDGYGNVAEVKFLSGDASSTGGSSSSGGSSSNSGSGSNSGGTSTSAGQLSGTAFGTAGSWNNSGNTFAKAFDGDSNTFFDSTQGTGAVAGLDLGSAQSVTSVKFMPRAGYGWRMTGGTFQGSNDNSSWTTLATISSAPADGQYTTLNLSGTYRYLRYVAPTDGFGNVAEIQFFGGSGNGSTTPTTPSTPSTGGSATVLTGTGFGTAGSWNNAGNTYDKALDGNADTFFDSTQANGAFVGLDLGSAKNVTAVQIAPRYGMGYRVTGATIQGSNDNSNWATLGTISNTPADGTLTTYNLTNPGSYRWVRFVSPANGYGNVAEVKFLSGDTSSTGGSSSNSGSSNSGGSAQDPSGPVVSNPTPNAPAPQPVISLLENSVTAGMAIHANAVNTVLNSGSPVTARYEWDFGDPNGKYNKLVGFNAAHVYDTPGTYNVTLKVTNEGGATATVTQKVTINADTRKTIYVDSANGNDNNAGTSTSTAVRSAARAFQLLGDNTKILFNRGQTFAVNDFLYATHSNITIGAYGSGANPVLQWQGPADNWREIISPSALATTDMTVENLTFDSVSGKPVGIAPRGTNITIRNCEFHNTSEAINAAGNPTGLLVQDNVQPANSGVTDYFLWLQGSDAVVVGNNVAAGAMYAIRTSGGTGQTITRALFAYNTLANDQRSNLRIQKGSYVYAANNNISSAGVEFGPLGQGDGFNDPNYATARTSYGVFENNVTNFRQGNYLRLSNGAEHIAIRNNVITHNADGEAISIEGYNPDYGREVDDVYVENNTVIDNTSSGNFLKLVGPERSAQISVMNNLFVAPNLTVGVDGAAPIYVNANDLGSFRTIQDNVWATGGTPNAWAAGGYNFVGTSYAYPNYLTPAAWNATSQADNDTFSNVAISGNYTPSGVAAAYSRSAPGVFTDIYGKARPGSGNWSVGAVQA